MPLLFFRATRIFDGGEDLVGERVARRSGKEYNGGVLRVDCMCMLDEIKAKRDEIYAIARAHKAEKLWVFGSCARKELVLS